MGVELGEDSEYADSDAFQSASSTDEEELASSRARYPEFNGEVDMKNPQFKVGMKFRDFKQFKEAVRNYGIQNRYVMNFRPNTKKKCKAFCKKGCHFYLWVSPMVGDKSTVQIKSGVFKHECSKDHNNRHVRANWIAMNYLEQFRANPNWAISVIVQVVKTNQKVNVSRLKAYRVKCIAHRMIDGDEESQILRLHDYRLELIRTHPRSIVIIECNEDVFEGIYICLAPLRAGFLAGCRRLVSLDGCWLKGLYGGQLLSVVGIDANDCIYPIAWAIVRRETKDSWTKFLQVLAQDLRINDSQQWAFMSDRQKGLMPAIHELFPNSEHRYCVRHIHTNFKQTYKGKTLKDQLWSCARATYLSAYKRAIEGLKGMSLGAFEYMKKIEPKHWSRLHFHTQFKCDILLNNMCEVFNSQILKLGLRESLQ
ncbi:uncharacterized protein LOC120257450 [Dioscorea cayenensis subsp. rotundata]|uniref:Uncharacterized protein LOC120257450 n=1 Tax=Dioscorea cayennensis subsp. rotundata TaxID=55577 RepID=A0AB40B2E1_DIOCR|nr:uncharacterized protein LOC120257450 [Dioscorea cayenensis subsp. rotundata]